MVTDYRTRPNQPARRNGDKLSGATSCQELHPSKITEGLDYLEALRVTGLRRMRPILLTMLTTVGGLVPLYLTGGALGKHKLEDRAFNQITTLLEELIFPSKAPPKK